MTEMEFRDPAMDNLLRHSLSAPEPVLPADFNQRVMRSVRQRSRSLERYYRMLLAGYGLSALMTSVVIMHGAGLSWAPITEVLAPFALVALFSARRISGPQSARRLANL